MSDIRLYFKNSAIRDEGDFLCLTDMWRAAEAEPSKRPAKWLETEAGKEFAEFIADSQGVAMADILRREHGNPQVGEGGATWAHWQLGMAYAKYLSPAFHAWCNDVVRKVMQGAVAAPELGALTALLRELCDRQTRLENNQAALWQKFGELSEQIPFGGAIPAARHNALVAEIRTLADVEVRIGRWSGKHARRGALADIRRELSDVTAWGGKGRPWNEMPAAIEPVARAVLRKRMKDATRADRTPPQLSLLKSERERSG